MLFNLLILILLGSTIYIYINKYCIDTTANVCTSNFISSFLNVLKYLGTIILKILYSAIDIIRKNPYPKPEIKKNKE